MIVVYFMSVFRALQWRNGRSLLYWRKGAKVIAYCCCRLLLFLKYVIGRFCSALGPQQVVARG